MINAALQAATFLIVAWLPGAVIFRLPLLDRAKRAALDAEERAYWAVILSVALSLSAVLLLAAFGRYSFPRLLALNLGVSVAVALAARGRLRLEGAKRPTATAAVPLLLIALGGWTVSRPAEYIMGGKDPGVYMNEGIQIAQRGSLVIEDETIAALPPFARDLFFPRHVHPDGTPRADYYGIRFMGFFVRDADTGTVVGQFPHLFPASIAIGYGIHGLTGARWVTPVWAILGLLGVYFAGTRLFGRAAAAAAAALLACNVAQVWFGRYPNAEMVMQAVLFAALLASARAHADGDRFFAPAAGWLLGLLLFLRLDTALAIAAVAAAMVVAWIAGRKPRPSFLIVFAIFAGAALAYYAGPMQPYSYRYASYVANLTTWHRAAIALGACLVVALLVVSARDPRVSAWLTPTIPTLLGASAVAAGVYALFLRHPGGRLAAHDAYALRTFANLYVTVPAVLAALLGFWLMVRQRFWKDPALFLTVFVFATSVFFKIRIVPEHFWMSRRFIPVVLPGALLFLAAAAFATATRGRMRMAVRWGVGAVFVGLLAVSYLRVSTPVLMHTEYEGLIPKIEALAGRFGDEDLVIVESRNAGGDVHVLATPLAYVYARRVLLLDAPRPDKTTLAAFVDWARSHYRDIYFVGGGGTDLLSHAYGMRAIASERFQVPEFEVATDGLPRRIARKEFEYGVYRFTDPQSPGPDAWFELDVGGKDDLHVLRFHAREQSDGRTFRWTAARSYIAVTTFHPGAREVQLVLHDGGRPPAAPPARLDVFLHNQRLGTIEVGAGGFRPYRLPIPPDLAARAAAAREPVELRLVSTTWTPREVLGVDDSRALGVMVDRVTIK